MSQITCHVIAPFHTRLVSPLWDHCAFTTKTLKLIGMLGSLGYNVIDYSNAGSQGEERFSVGAVDLDPRGYYEHVEMLSWAGFTRHFKDDGLPGDANLDSEGCKAFNHELKLAIGAGLRRPGRHVILHSFGDAARFLMQEHSGVLQIESGVGYDRAPFGARRVFESDQWRHHLWGKYGSTPADRTYSWVIPNAVDPLEWPLRAGDGGYIAFMGRVTPQKGMNTIREIAKRLPGRQFKIAGAGEVEDRDEWPTNVAFIGPLRGGERAQFLGEAAVTICPTEYIEPFGGVAIESMFCGTPVVASSWGAFGSTVVPGSSGALARTLGDWIRGIDAVGSLYRPAVAGWARDRFALGAIAPLYHEAISQLIDLHGAGWYA